MEHLIRDKTKTIRVTFQRTNNFSRLKDSHLNKYN